MFAPGGPTLLELTRQALSSTVRGYDLLAPKFDATPFRTPRPILDATARYLDGLGTREWSLDLCCGTGAVLEILVPRSRRAVGLDFSEGMLAVAAARLGGTASLVLGEALAPPFAPRFDLVTCFSALGHFLPTQQRRLVGAIGDCLRPGGRFLFVTARRPSRLSRAYWLARGFNAVMRVRNLVWAPPFVMYYLTFLLPEATRLLEETGFEVGVIEGLFPPPFERYLLVEAVKVGGATEDTSAPEAPRRPRRSGR